MTDHLPHVFRAAVRPAALFLAGATLAIGTLSADPAPAFPVASPTLIAAAAMPQTDGISHGTIDANGDGAIDRAEFALWFETNDPTADAFALFDADGSEGITGDEWEVLAFELLD